MRFQSYLRMFSWVLIKNTFVEMHTFPYHLKKSYYIVTISRSAKKQKRNNILVLCQLQ